MMVKTMILKICPLLEDFGCLLALLGHPLRGYGFSRQYYDMPGPGSLHPVLQHTSRDHLHLQISQLGFCAGVPHVCFVLCVPRSCVSGWWCAEQTRATQLLVVIRCWQMAVA